jgi:hypothetical protein
MTGCAGERNLEPLPASKAGGPPVHEQRDHLLDNQCRGFDRQHNPDLNTTNWLNVSTPPVVVGEEKRVVVPSPLGNRIYRLKKTSGP